MTPDTLPLLQKLCDLQQQQVEKLAEISKHLDEITEGTRNSTEQYQKQNEIYEKELGEYRNRVAQNAQRGLVIAFMLGLIALSIIISRFI